MSDSGTGTATATATATDLLVIGMRALYETPSDPW